MTVALSGQRWNSEQAREAGRKSAEVRAAKRAELNARRAQVERITSELDRTQIGPATLAAALTLAQAAIAGDIPIPRDALERKRLAETAEILHRIGRLEMGESTANVEHAALSDVERASRLAALRSQLGVIDVESSSDSQVDTPPH